MSDPDKLRLADALAKAEIDRRDAAQRRMPGIGQLIALGGRLGWTVALPLVGAAWGGRALDRHFGTGIQITAALIVLAAAIGFAAMWRGISR
jgi:hypothetical protein